MPRALHRGRPGPDPFADGSVAAAQTAMEHALPETCKFGTLSEETSPDPPYQTVTTIDPVATDVPCLLEPGIDQPVDVAGDPSMLSLFDLRVPHGTAIDVDHAVEITAGRNVGLQVQVSEVHDSSTEPLLRVTCERITGGEP